MIFSHLKCFDHWAVCFDVSFIVSERVDNQFEKGKKLLKFSSTCFFPIGMGVFPIGMGVGCETQSLKQCHFFSFDDWCVGLNYVIKQHSGLRRVKQIPVVGQNW